LGLASISALRRHVPDEWFLGLAGVASIGFVVVFLLVRTAEAGATLTWFGCYSGFSAICMLGLALRLRGLRASIHRMAQSPSQ